MQRQLLNSHVADFTDKQAVFAAAVDGVDGAELLRQLPCFTKFADDGSIQFHLVDLTAGIDIFGRI